MVQFQMQTILTLAACLALALPTHAQQNTNNDGTYRVVTVTSFEDCNALCKADSKCKGATAIQEDTRYDIMQCRLNNGFGTESPFKSIAPTPLNLNIALADFNAYRAQKNLSPVTLNAKLNAASQVHAEDLAKHGNISHTGSDGSSHGERVSRQDYVFSIAAENVATGQKSWERVFKAWQGSPGHNKNLLQPNVTEFGIALVYNPKTSYETYWAMLVAAPLSAPQFSH